MKRTLLALFICLSLSSVAGAQQAAAAQPSATPQTGPDAPASREDIQRYLDAIHERELMKSAVESMSIQMQSNVREQLKKQPNLTPEDIDRIEKTMSDSFKDMPIDDLLNAMIPVFQKHLTKGNVQDLIAFYSTPTGQKMLKELPAMTGEAMQAASGITQKYTASAVQKAKEQVSDIEKSKTDSSAPPALSTSPN